MFQAEFTVEADKNSLVEVMLGLWAYTYRATTPDKSAVLTIISDIVNSAKKDMFPEQLCGSAIKYLESNACLSAFDKKEISSSLDAADQLLAKMIAAHSSSSDPRAKDFDGLTGYMDKCGGVRQEL